MMPLRASRPSAPIVRGNHVEAVIPQRLRDDVAEVRVVFDDENAVTVELRKRNNEGRLPGVVIVYGLGPPAASRRLPWSSKRRRCARTKTGRDGCRLLHPSERR